MLCSKFKLISTSIFQVTAIKKNAKIFKNYNIIIVYCIVLYSNYFSFNCIYRLTFTSISSSTRTPLETTNNLRYRVKIHVHVKYQLLYHNYNEIYLGWDGYFELILTLIFHVTAILRKL